MKTKEELNALKNEIETVKKKLAELDKDELRVIIGGIGNYPLPGTNDGKNPPPPSDWCVWGTAWM